MLSIERHLDLLRIGIADCRYHISIYDTALEIVGITICLQLVTGEIILVQACDVNDLLLIPDTLELQVMYRHDRLDTMVERVIIEAVLNIYRDQSCLPVMAVDDIRTEIQRRHCRQCCFTEKCKLLNILENIAIWMKSCEIELIIDKIEMNSLILHL